jgi:hypothetical protein
MHRPRLRTARLRFEVLEERTLLSTYTVDHLADDMVGDGLSGSLRYCITNAIDGDDIQFAMQGTINLTGALPDLTHNINIQGPGADLLAVRRDTSDPYRIFSVYATVNISGLSITGGYGVPYGGGLYNNGGTVTIADCAINGNSADLGGGIYTYNGTLAISDSTLDDNAAAYGGGLYNNSYNAMSLVTITDTAISGNSATSSGGGLEDNSGGLASNNGGTISISGCTVCGNSAVLGSGVHSYGGMVTVADSAICYNTATDGGGLYCVGKVGSLVTIIHSFISANSAADSAGLANNGGTMTIADSTICGNAATGDGVAGGGVDNYTGATLTILGSTISGNYAGAYGGGIDNIEGATATVVDSTISNNHTDGLGGGIYTYNATLTIITSSLRDNAAAYGGGLYNNSYQNMSTAMITDSSISNNTALQGGGIDNDNGATLMVTGSTLSGNTAGSGGGLHNYAGTVTVAESTISGNTASGNGGGLANNSGTLTMTESTIADNTVINSGYGGGLYNNQMMTTRNVIIAGNTATNGPDVSGNLGSQGHNLISNDAEASGFDLTDLLNLDPLLGPLQDNGGPTFTMALLDGSPAIDAGDNTDAPDWDQRGPGFPRIVGIIDPENPNIDIGAFEVQAPQKHVAPAPFARAPEQTPSVAISTPHALQQVGEQHANMIAPAARSAPAEPAVTDLFFAARADWKSWDQEQLLFEPLGSP